MWAVVPDSMLTQGGVFAVCLTVAFYLLKRADDRETVQHAQYASELAAERLAHDETRHQLHELTIRIADCEARCTQLAKQLGKRKAQP